MSKNEIKEYSKGDFLETAGPFEDVYAYINDPFEMNRFLERMSDYAKSVGFKGFKTAFKEYERKMKNIKAQFIVDSVTDFDGQIMELNTGPWIASDGGIYKDGPYGPLVACVHPIMPVQRLVNVDSGIVKVKIAYRLGGIWKTAIIEKRVLASASSIVSLSDYGIAVTSENAKILVQFIHDVENLNFYRIPEAKSVARLGWVSGEEFSPYVKDILYDGELSFKHIFENVKEKGSLDKWVETVREFRADSRIVRILLAASFASVLVEPCHALPFFVHLWGTSGGGKTVGLMLAASVWADPSMGKYVSTFNSTSVALELRAGFLNSLPLCIDELQIQASSGGHGKSFDNIIYFLTEGVGRDRGAKTGGLRQLNHWHNTIITTGEYPISNTNSGAGAIARIIEIDIGEEQLFKDPRKAVKDMRKAFGGAGKHFVKKLKEGGLEEAREVQEKYHARLANNENSVGKQDVAASILLTADHLIEKWFFKDSLRLTVKDMERCMPTKDEVDQNLRAMEWIFGFVATNKVRFTDQGSGGEMWGESVGNYIYVIKSIFDQKITEAGFSSTAFLAWAKRKGHLSVDDGKRTKKKRLTGYDSPVNCVCLKTLEYQGEWENLEEAKEPF